MYTIHAPHFRACTRVCAFSRSGQKTDGGNRSEFFKDLLPIVPAPTPDMLDGLLAFLLTLSLGRSLYPSAPSLTSRVRCTAKHELRVRSQAAVFREGGGGGRVSLGMCVWVSLRYTQLRLPRHTPSRHQQPAPPSKAPKAGEGKKRKALGDVKGGGGNEGVEGELRKDGKKVKGSEF